MKSPTMPSRFLLCCFTLALFFSRQTFAQPENLFAQYQHARAGLAQEPMKCGFSALATLRHAPQLQPLWKSISARPVLPNSYATSDNRFRIHYTTTGADAVAASSTNPDGVPDFVYEAGRAAQRAYALLVDSLGMRAHAFDGGVDGNEFDFYIINLGSLYGETRFEFSGGSGPAYIVIDNNYGPEFFSQGLNGLRVTVAHEYFHAVQLNYLLRDEDIFFFEISSVWFEDAAYDEVNDYFAYLRRWFRDTDLPLNTRNGSHEYGSAIWLHYLTQRLQSRAIVRALWERIVQEPATLALKNTLQVAPYLLPLGTAMQEFYTWCYFTGYRADGEKYFSEGGDYPSVQFELSQTLFENTSFPGTANPWAARYYRFIRTAQDLQANLQVTTDPGRFGLTAISYDQDDEYLVRHAYGSASVLAEGQARQDTVVLAVVNGSVPASGSAVNDYELLLILGDKAELEEGLGLPYPNPFRPRLGALLRVPYSLKQATTVEAVIFGEDGRVVWKEKSFARVPAGSYEIVWDGFDAEEQPVPSGVYVLRVIAGSLSASTKIAVINR